jgi:predicted nucleotide-binding protein (sugar kinase/HSP70/actin superfamily)
MDTIEPKRTVRLPITNAKVPDLDIDGELARFEAEEKARLGLAEGKEHWRDEVAQTFTGKQRSHTTILVSGLTMAHDYFVEGALAGLGYKVKHLDCPDNNALRVGKEFGNRGQCNPTYFTVGNVVKYLVYLRDEQKMSVPDIIENYVFLTAGACGPCRFGMYATEYRKALRDAGFEGFRVMLFQQQGGLKQATGEERGLDVGPKFFFGLVKGLIAGDVINALGYRVRPYELVPGAATDALERGKKMVYDALRENRSILPALLNVRRLIKTVEVDKTIAKPKVSIIGEFWAMTTEGDGNYHLQQFLEQEGAECDIQLVTAWILFMVWEQTYDTRERMGLRGSDKGKKSIKDLGAAWKKLLGLKIADKGVRVFFQTYAKIVGLHGYKLPNLDEVAAEAAAYYNLNVRGGEAHMEVGKLVLTTKHKKANMVLSVKPFGCMPSSGVSDGVQTIITEKHPDAVFLPIETTGDGAVNVQSRVQMMLFRARQIANGEVAAALAETGLSRASLDKLTRLPWLRTALHQAPHSHKAGSTAANLVYEAATWKKRLGPVARFF